MQLSIENLSLPTHILSALRGDIIAGNTITPSAPNKAHQALTHAPVVINLQANIDSAPCELECIELSELTSYDILE